MTRSSSEIGAMRRRTPAATLARVWLQGVQHQQDLLDRADGVRRRSSRMAILAPLLAPYDPIDAEHRTRSCSRRRRDIWLGTDSFGRDIWSRLLYGARISLVIGIVSTVAAMVIGSADRR